MSNKMLLDVPDGVIWLLNDISAEYRHDENGAGDIMCPTCGGSVRMCWNNGIITNSESDIRHDADCPIVWARTIEVPNVKLCLAG